MRSDHPRINILTTCNVPPGTDLSRTGNPTRRKNKEEPNDMKHFSMKTTFGLCATTLLLATACTQELADNPAGNARAISFQTPQADTRAAVNGNGDLGNFSVWGWYGETEGSTDKNVFDGKEIKAPNWTYDGGAQYWIPGKKYNFYGVYPVLPTKGNGTTVAVTYQGVITVNNFDCSQTGTKAVDLMTATAPGDGDNPDKVKMEFQHELAKVYFTVESESAVTVTKCKIYGVNYKGTFNNSNWTDLTANGQKDEIFNAPAFSLNTTGGLSRNVFGDMLLIPHDATQLGNAKLDFSYRYSGEEETTEHASTMDLNTSVTAWETGKSYHYKITIQGAKLKLNVTVLDWNEQDTSVKW